MTGLQPINVFHGENNVGKSNLLEAMELFFRLVVSLPSTRSYAVELPLQECQDHWGLGREAFSWGGDGKILFSTVSEGQGTMLRNGKMVAYEDGGIRIRSGNAVVLPDYVLEALGVSQGDAAYFHREKDRIWVLNGTQLEELWRPQAEEG